MDLYAGLKVIHILAVIIWVGGMLAVAAVIDLDLRRGKGATPAAGLDHPVPLRLWMQWAVAPAMLTAWVAGLMLAKLGGWFAMGWLPVKLVPAVILSALHGVLSGWLRRQVGPPGLVLGPILRHGATATLLGAAVAVTLVVLKPF